MANQRAKSKQVFYDVIYSPDDGGYYCESFTKNCADTKTTEVHPAREDAINEVLAEFPNARKLREF